MGDVVSLFADQSGAVIDGLYRYRLWRTWDETVDRLGWVMLNPSVADASIDDRTIRKCMGFARRGGFGSIEVVNLYAYRATDPLVLRNAIRQFGDRFAIGPHNEAALLQACRSCTTMVAAWGAQPFAVSRAVETTSFLRSHHPNVVCLGKTQDGHPRHPLYLANKTVFEVF